MDKVLFLDAALESYTHCDQLLCIDSKASANIDVVVVRLLHHAFEDNQLPDCSYAHSSRTRISICCYQTLLLSGIVEE